MPDKLTVMPTKVYEVVGGFALGLESYGIVGKLGDFRYNPLSRIGIAEILRFGVSYIIVGTGGVGGKGECWLMFDRS